MTVAAPATLGNSHLTREMRPDRHGRSEKYRFGFFVKRSMTWHLSQPSHLTASSLFSRIPNIALITTIAMAADFILSVTHVFDFQRRNFSTNARACSAVLTRHTDNFFGAFRFDCIHITLLKALAKFVDKIFVTD